MKDYALVTDATCDLPAEVLEKLNVRVIPMEFQIDGILYRHYPDTREMSLTTFYEWTTAGETPSTSQISQLTYFKYFEAVLGADMDVLYLSFASGLGGTYQSSLIAAAELEEKYLGQRAIYIDSLCASIGQGLFVLLATQKEQEGLTIGEIVARAQRSHLYVARWSTVDDLSHLRRGGRISPVTALAGSALGIKPILRVDGEGKLIVAMKVRGHKKLMDALTERIIQTDINPAGQVILVEHGNNERDAKQLEIGIHERFHPKEIILCGIGPAIDVRVGPGTLAISFWASEN